MAGAETEGAAAWALAGASADAIATMATRIERRAMPEPSDTCSYLHGGLPSGRHRTVRTGRIGSPGPSDPPKTTCSGGLTGWIFTQ